MIFPLFLLLSCSTTRHLPEGERLYTGQRKMIVNDLVESPAATTAMEEVEAALAKAPNNALPGSSVHRTPLPIGLWFYTGFKRYEKGFGRWVFNRFATTPVLLSVVNPDVRSKVGTNILHDYGYFSGEVTHQILIDPKDSLKAKVQYTVNMRNPYFIDTVYYERFNKQTLPIIEAGRRRTLLAAGKQFSVIELDAERERISALLRGRGYYYFRPDYLTFQADTTRASERVSLKIIPIAGLPQAAQKQYFVGQQAVYLTGRKGARRMEQLRYRDLEIFYTGKRPAIRPEMIYRWVNFLSFAPNIATRNEQRMRQYNQYRHQRTQERLNGLGLFSALEFQYVPRDSMMRSDTLDLNIRGTLDKPLSIDLELNLTSKSNDQVGPGAVLSISRKNVFRGGETWNVQLRGSYEWQTGSKDGDGSLLNSYEIGLSTALTLPRLLFPHVRNNEYDFSTNTSFRLYADQLNRAKYYKILSFGGNVTYEWRPQRTKRHSFTPFRLTFNTLQRTTEAFDEILAENEALAVSMRDQFIPAMEYTYTYDNGTMRRQHNPLWWQTNVVSAGNITAAAYRAFGRPFDEQEKVLLGVPFAQFLKVNSELRYSWRFSGGHSLATRVSGGVIWPYGNSGVAPYTEQFYAGGANSIRAFTVRSIGPGSYRPADGSRYSYIDQVGDLRLEANAEYRFPLTGDLHGALFLDAGNVWLLRDQPERPGGKLRLRELPRQVALGTGFGLRYDMDFLIVRIDCGVALHAPYETGKRGYYNIGKFSDGLGIHFAVGYPF